MAKTNKLWYVWTAVAAVLIIVGIVLNAVFGMNGTADITSAKQITVSYDTVVSVTDKEEDLAKLCEDAFSANKLGVLQKQKYQLSTGYTYEYTFAGDTSDETLATVKTAIVSAIDANEAFDDSEIFVTVHTAELNAFAQPVWRAVIALAVGVVVGLIYLGIRYKVTMALTGLAVVAENTLLSLALVAIFRIPVYGYAPMIFAGVAAVLSLAVWAFQCGKAKEVYTAPENENLGADEKNVLAFSSSAKKVAIALGVVAVFFLAFGLLATEGVRMFFLPALVPVAVTAFTAFLFAPSVFAQCKGVADAIVEKRKRYDFKKNSEQK